MIPAPVPILVGLGGALGAVLRYAVGEALADAETSFPAATLTVNTLGTFALGLLTFAGASDDALLLLGTGTCGAFTTFSSFSVEAVEALEDGDWWLAVGYAGGTLVFAGVALGIAWLLVGWFS